MARPSPTREIKPPHSITKDPPTTSPICSTITITSHPTTPQQIDHQNGKRPTLDWQCPMSEKWISILRQVAILMKITLQVEVVIP